MIKLLLGIIVFIVVLGLIFTLLLVGGVATIARKFMGRGAATLPVLTDTDTTRNINIPA